LANLETMVWPFQAADDNEVCLLINSTLDVIQGIVDIDGTLLDPYNKNRSKNLLGFYWNVVWAYLQSTWASTQALGKQLWRYDYKTALQNLSLQEMKDKALHLWQVLQRHAHEIFDYLLHCFVVTWVHEKTGIRPHILLSAGLIMVAGLMMFVMWKYHKRPRHNKRRKERSLSISGRGLRDRGFSFDLADHQVKDRKKRGANPLDFFSGNKNKKTTRVTRPDSLLGSSTSGGNRSRSNSLDLLSSDQLLDDNAQQHGMGTVGRNRRHQHPSRDGSSPDGYDRPVVQATTHSRPHVTYHGPTEQKLLYFTWSPPPSWMEASRSLLPLDTRMKLQREISLDLSKHDECLMTIREPTTTSSTTSRQTPVILPVTQLSVHVKNPIIGGVLEIYVKDSSKEEWMEHTFDNAKNAAQFQIDLLAIQFFGPAIFRMYQSLELIHQGSIACEGREYVCHNDEMTTEVPQGVGVTWDDVMRAIGSNLPSLRVALERLWWHHYTMTSLRLRARKRARQQKQKKKKGDAASFEGDDSEAPAAVGSTNAKEMAEKDPTANVNQDAYIHLSAEYVRKRLLLGPIDFFRLFVPWLPETALPRRVHSKENGTTRAMAKTDGSGLAVCPGLRKGPHFGQSGLAAESTTPDALRHSAAFL